jgi:hypothetical protein
MFPQFLAEDLVIQLPPAYLGNVTGWAQENGRCLHGDAYNTAIENCDKAFKIRNTACDSVFAADLRFGDYRAALAKVVICNAASDALLFQCRQQAVEQAPICPTPCDQCRPWGCFTSQCAFGRVLNLSNCRCECGESCPPGQVQNPRTCSCACPPCVWGQAQNPETCVCTCPNGEPACASLCCPTGWGCCGDPSFCRPLDTRANCGVCGNSCKSGMDCQNGTCVCETGTLCNGVCVNTTSDRNNCGACGSPCVDVQSCEAGTCACPPSKPSLCNNVCVQTTGTDSNNCGECGLRCLPGQDCTFDPDTGQPTSCTNYDTSCQYGRCVCTSGFYGCGPNWCASINFPNCCYSTLGIEAACPGGSICVADSSSPLGFKCQ